MGLRPLGLHNYIFFSERGPTYRGRFKRWPVASEIIGGPVSLTYDWPVWPANIFILDLRQNVPLQPMTSCGL